jgi:hypothetical protein
MRGLITFEMTDSNSQRKYSLAALVIGAAIARGDVKGFGAAIAVLLLYYAVNLYEARRASH